jgi:hypothetical protein
MLYMNRGFFSHPLLVLFSMCGVWRREKRRKEMRKLYVVHLARREDEEAC